jgi:hypothetical protein
MEISNQPAKEVGYLSAKVGPCPAYQAGAGTCNMLSL